MDYFVFAVFYTTNCSRIRNRIKGKKNGTSFMVNSVLVGIT